MTYGNALAALADPTRRHVFERLRNGPASVGAIAQTLPVSRPAVSQHLKVLKAAGLVTDRADGTRRVYEIDPRGLGALRGWLDQFREGALGAFVAEVERQTTEQRLVLAWQINANWQFDPDLVTEVEVRFTAHGETISAW